jgi:hypothetical protein
MFFNRQVFVKAAPGEKGVPSGTVTSAINCARSQVENAAAFCVVMVAAGAKDIKTAATTIINLVDILGIMTVSFIKAKKTAMSLMEDGKTIQKFQFDYTLFISITFI